MSEDFCTLPKDLKAATFSEFHRRYLGEIERAAVVLEITFRSQENSKIKKFKRELIILKTRFSAFFVS